MTTVRTNEAPAVVLQPGDDLADLHRPQVTRSGHLGSGITPENIARYRGADAFIVGSSVKMGGVWSGELDPRRTRAVMEALLASSIDET